MKVASETSDVSLGRLDESVFSARDYACSVLPVTFYDPLTTRIQRSNPLSAIGVGESVRPAG